MSTTPRAALRASRSRKRLRRRTWTRSEETPMRLIHTADWHLCDRLGRVNRTADLKRRVERVAELCQEHAVDVLLIAGDLFSEQASPEDMTEALKHIQTTFAEFF